MLRTFRLLLLLPFLHLCLHGGESGDDKLLAALTAIEDARKPGAKPNALENAVERFNSALDLANPRPVEATWNAIVKRLPRLLKDLEPRLLTRLLYRVARDAPEPQQAPVMSWRADGLDTILARLAGGIDSKNLNDLGSLGALLPKPDERLRLAQGWPPRAWTQRWMRDFATLYAPRAKRFEALMASWRPMRDPDCGSPLARTLPRHPLCLPALGILLERCASADAGTTGLQCGMVALRRCVAPIPQGVALIKRGVPHFGDDFPLGVDALTTWRGDPALAAVLYPLMRDAAKEPFGLRPGDPGSISDPWTVVLPPPAQRGEVVMRLLDGLETGIAGDGVAGAAARRRTLQLCHHVLAFPEAYAGTTTPVIQQRIDALLQGKDEVCALLAFNLLGHLAGPAGIDAAYVTALPRLHDLLIPHPVNLGSRKLRGLPENDTPDLVRHLLYATRLRLTLCRLPLAGQDRERVFAWSRENYQVKPAIAAWLARTAPAGQHPFTGLVADPVAEFPRDWPQWSGPAPVERPRPAPDWRADLGAGLIHLRDFPDWAEGPAVITAALADAKECERLVNLLVDEEKGRQPSLRQLVRDHAGLRAFLDTQATALTTADKAPPGAPRPIDHYRLARTWGEAVGDRQRAAAVAAEYLAGTVTGLGPMLADLARWAPEHPLLDTLQAEWQAPLSAAPQDAFKAWALAVLRGRDPGPFPEASWRHQLFAPDGWDLFGAIRLNPERFAPHVDALRAPCPPNLALCQPLALALAAVQAAADRKR